MMMRLFSNLSIIVVFISLLTMQAHAQSTVAIAGEHQLVRRLAVFPFKMPEGSEAIGEDAWWRTREEFTKSKRFLVASKQFLIKSDTFQPRGDLEPADCLILAKLLDAHALITFQLLDRKLVLNVYDGSSGLTLWRRSVQLHPSLTVKDQLGKIAVKMVDEFIANIPYQGFTVVDSMVGTPIFEEGDVRLSQVDLGVASTAEIGDIVQWMKLISQTVQPVFQGGAKLVVFAEGKIVRIEQGIATVELSRVTSLKDIREYSLVRVPREAEHLKVQYTISDAPRSTLTAELIAPEISPMQELAKERKPLVTTLSVIGSLSAFLLLAF